MKNALDQDCWHRRHAAAMACPRDGHEAAMVKMLTGWLEYQSAHAERFKSGIGDDYVLGPEWEAIGNALRGLLNGETGWLDCGTLDGVILDALKAEGFEEA